METNSRIIRGERDESQIFDEASRPTPRIDLILGVTLAAVAGALGVLSSFGVGGASQPTELIRPSAQVALAEPTPFEPESLELTPFETAPIVVASPDVDLDKVFVFETASAPATPRTPDGDAARAHFERALACLDEVRRDAQDGGAVDHRSVIRFLGAAMDDPRFDASFDTAIGEVTITIESLVEEMETPRMADPAWTAPTPDRRPRALRLPVRTLGL